MESKTYSQRTDRMGNRPQVSVQTAVDGSGEVIVTVGPHGGPYQTVYLSAEQALMVGASFIQMSDEVKGIPGTHSLTTAPTVWDDDGEPF